MPCPKCNGILAREDGVVFCENPACFHVVKRRGDPRFSQSTKPEEKPPSISRVARGENKGKICIIEGCNKPVRSKGLCKRCYERYGKRKRKGLTPDKFRGRYFVHRICITPGCGKKHLAKGYCKKCYGQHFAVSVDYRRSATPKERRCSLCMRIHFAKGLCRRHYNQVHYFEMKWRHVYAGMRQNL